MLEISKDKVVIPREIWEELRKNNYFRELIEVIEDREALQKAIEETEYFVDYDEYKKTRNSNKDV